MSVIKNPYPIYPQASFYLCGSTHFAILAFIMLQNRRQRACNSKMDVSMCERVLLKYFEKAGSRNIEFLLERPYKYWYGRPQAPLSDMCLSTIASLVECLSPVCPSLLPPVQHFKTALINLNNVEPCLASGGNALHAKAIAQTIKLVASNWRNLKIDSTRFKTQLRKAIASQPLLHRCFAMESFCLATDHVIVSFLRKT